MAAAMYCEFTVECRIPGSFPIDMLRYDGCHPTTQDDVNKMLGRIKVGTKIRLSKVYNNVIRKGYEIAEDRWASFGFQVIQKSTRKL